VSADGDDLYTDDDPDEAEAAALAAPQPPLDGSLDGDDSVHAPPVELADEPGESS
jgi:hypothetical protein